MIRKVNGHSMIPMLPPKTTVWGLKWFNTLKVGNIVIFKHDDKEKIKRIDQIKDGKLYLLGDHLEASTDSRSFGWIETDHVIAKVIWPKTHIIVEEN